MNRSEAIKKALKGTKDYHETMLAVLMTFSVQKPQKGQNFEEIEAFVTNVYDVSVYNSERRGEYWDKIGIEVLTWVIFKAGGKGLRICFLCTQQMTDFFNREIVSSVRVQSHYCPPYKCGVCGANVSDDIPF